MIFDFWGVKKNRSFTENIFINKKKSRRTGFYNTSNRATYVCRHGLGGVSQKLHFFRGSFLVPLNFGQNYREKLVIYGEMMWGSNMKIVENY